MRGVFMSSLACFMVLMLGGGVSADGLVPTSEETGPVLVPAQGPYVRPVTEPVARIMAFEGDLWAWTEGIRTTTVTLPDVAWDRVFVRFHSWPNGPQGDPWDRLYTVHIGGAEVLRGVTPRADFEVRDDITEYAPLLAGPEAQVSVHLSSWADNGLLVTLELLFHAEATHLIGDAPAGSVVPAFTHAGLGAFRSGLVSFPASSPTQATIEIFTTGHGADGEFWYLNALGQPEPPRLKVYVDGEHVGTVHALPYVYALAGVCCGATTMLVNQLVWWSAHQVLNEAGIYTGVGTVPPYRSQIPVDLLPLLSGDRVVEIVKETHGGHWPTSVNFLLG